MNKCFVLSNASDGRGFYSTGVMIDDSTAWVECSRRLDKPFLIRFIGVSLIYVVVIAALPVGMWFITDTAPGWSVWVVTALGLILWPVWLLGFHPDFKVGSWNFPVDCSHMSSDVVDVWCQIVHVHEDVFLTIISDVVTAPVDSEVFTKACGDLDALIDRVDRELSHC